MSSIAAAFEDDSVPKAQHQNLSVNNQKIHNSWVPSQVNRQTDIMRINTQLQPHHCTNPISTPDLEKPTPRQKERYQAIQSSIQHAWGG